MPAASLRCISPIIELKDMTAAFSGGSCGSRYSRNGQDRPQQKTEQGSISFSSSAQIVKTHHLASTLGGKLQSYTSDQEHLRLSGIHAHSYSTADVIKKLRIPSKQVPNPDEARRLARMHEWQVTAAISQGLTIHNTFK